MANIKANVKSIRKNAKRTKINRSHNTALKNLVKKARASKKQEDINAVYAKADSLVAKGVIHKNKAQRIKSRVVLNANKK